MIDPLFAIGSSIAAVLGACVYFVMTRIFSVISDHTRGEDPVNDEYAFVRENKGIFSEQNVYIDTDYFGNCPVEIHGRVDRHTFELYARGSVIFSVSREHGGEIDNDAYDIDVQYGEPIRVSNHEVSPELDHINFMNKPYPGWMTPEEALLILSICVGKFREMKGAANES